jgi:photosystem II stability/assembly factor-like uncharacterized protein
MNFFRCMLMNGTLASILSLLILSQLTGCSEEESPSDEKQILSFAFLGLTPSVSGTIDENNHTVILDVPAGTDLSNLVPTITLSPKATIAPASDMPRNFTNPVSYSVMAEDQTTQSYTITVTSADKQITSFQFETSVSASTGMINEINHTIVVKVPYNTDVTSLTPVILFKGKSINPASGVAQNFTAPVAYAVTASNGSTQSYSVSVEVQPVNAASIAWSSAIFSRNFIRSMTTSGKDILVAHDGGIDRSSDNGKTWAPITPSSIFFVRTITISGNHIYAGTDSKIHHSADNGATWSTLLTAGSNSYIFSILVNGSSIIAASFSKGVYISNDGGANWTNVNNGLTSLNLISLVKSGNNLITNTAGNAFISSDAGANWNPLSLAAARNFLAVGNNLFASSGGSAYISTNNGTTWTPANTGITGTISGFCSDKNNIFAATSTGLFLSSTMGASWTPLGAGWPGSGISGIAVCGPSIFAYTATDVYKSPL